MKYFNSREEYFGYNAINNSLLKAMDQSPMNLIGESEDLSVKEAIQIGDAVDTLVFDGLTEFEKRFSTEFYTEKPTASTLVLANAYIEHCKNNSLLSSAQEKELLVLKLIQKLDLWKKTLPENKMSKITPEFWSYVETVLRNADKITFNAELYVKIQECAEILRTDDLTKHYFNPEPDCEVHHQLAFSFDYDELKEPIECKAMLDVVYIDHAEKTIEPIDLKTTSSSLTAEGMRSTIVKYRYDIQDELYTYGIKQWRNKNYPGYTIKPFTWVLINPRGNCKPYIYEIWNIRTWRNRVNSIRLNPLKNLEELMKQFIWHRDNQRFEYIPEMYERGRVRLDR